MKRILYLAVCAILLVGLITCLAACSGTEGTDSSSSKSESVGTGSSDTADSSNDSSNSGAGSAGSSTEDSVPSTNSSNQKPPVDGHEHTYESTYSYDAQNHYYAANCEHKDEVKDSEPHSYDENGDCKCGYHQHTYSTEYSFDADNHFNRATCIHKEEIANVEAHSYNEENVCKCGKVKDEVQDIILAIIANRDKITSGTSVQTSYNNVLNSVSASNIVFKFYDSYVYVKQQEDYVNEYYYSYDNGKLNAIFIQNGANINVDTEASEDNLYGARYILGCVDEYETFVCGSESLIEFFYKTGLEKGNDVFNASNEGDLYAFSYGYCIVDDWANYYYQITASFIVDEATGTLKTANITVDRFASDSYTVVDGKYIVNDGAQPNFKTTFEIEQTTKALDNVENPYDSSKVLLDSIAIKDRNGNDIEEIVINARADDLIKIFLADITPSSALLSLCEIELLVKNEADGELVTISPFFNSYDNSYSFYINTPGTYEISVRVNDMIFVTTAEILARIPVAISAQVYDVDSGVFDKTKKAEVYAGSPLYITSYVESGYDGDFTAKIIGTNAASATLTDGEIGGMKAAVFKSDVLGNYTIEIVSTAKKSVSCQLTVTVVEAPSVEDVLFGEYFANDDRGNKIVNAVFDSKNSVVDVTYIGAYGEEITQLSYSVADGKINFTVSDGDEFVEEFYVNELYQVVMVIYGEEYVLEQVYVESVLVSTGTMTVEDIAQSGKYSGTYAYELYSTGAFAIFKDYSKVKDISLTMKNEAYMFKVVGTEEQALVKVNGDDGELAGEYTIENVVNVTITVDKEITPVMEPQYGTLEVIDHVAVTSDRNKSFVYRYEIIDGEFVFYRYDEVTEDVSLTELGGEYSFKFENIASASVIEKIEGPDDILGGTYVIEKYMPSLIRFAEIIIKPGAQGPQSPVIEEDPYGLLILEDKLNVENSATYHYEIVDGSFVIYKDGALVTDIVITSDSNSYYIQGGTLKEPTLLNKLEGEKYALAGYYEAYNEIEMVYGITFVPGLVEDEEPMGILEIVDNNTGVVSGTYTYEIVDGRFVIYKDGVVTNDVLVIELPDGNYLFQCVGIVPQTLVKVEGMSLLLEGTYYVNGKTDGVYVLTFTSCYIEKAPVYVEEGTLDIVDSNAGTVGGSYTYKITDDGAIHIFNNEEMTNEINISRDLSGEYTFQCNGLMQPKILNKVEGDKGEISGVYTVLDGETVKYELTFTKDGYQIPQV